MTDEEKRSKKVNAGKVRVWRADAEAPRNCGWFWQAWRGNEFRAGHSHSRRTAWRIACAMLHGERGEVYVP